MRNIRNIAFDEKGDDPDIVTVKLDPYDGSDPVIFYYDLRKTSVVNVDYYNYP